MMFLPLVCVSVWFLQVRPTWKGGRHSKEAAQPSHHPHSDPALHAFGFGVDDDILFSIMFYVGITLSQ
jgi:hypothetical protein